ncbi:unnamed protein product, partial [Tenebrio molitor]
LRNIFDDRKTSEKKFTFTRGINKRFQGCSLRLTTHIIEGINNFAIIMQ